MATRIEKLSMSEVIRLMHKGWTDAMLITEGATVSQVEWARNPPPPRNEDDDRFLITIEGVKHTVFKATAETEGAAQASATKVASWAMARGKRVIVTDRVPVSKEIDYFGKTKTVEVRPVVFTASGGGQRIPADTRAGGLD